MKKRLLASFLTIVMLLGMLPTSVFAANYESAKFYYLANPLGDPDSNYSSYSDSLGRGEVDDDGLTWVGGGITGLVIKNSYGPDLESRVNWPTEHTEWSDTYNAQIIKPSSTHWSTTFNAYQTSVESELGLEITEEDVDAIILHPHKVSNNLDGYHVDCTVEIKCKDIITAIFYVWDDEEGRYLQEHAQNYKVGAEVEAVGTYDWYTNEDCTGEPVEFPYTAYENINFYTGKHTHDYESEVTKEPTCTEEGVTTFTCSCGDSYTESIDALGHDYESEVTTKPTCTTKGVETFTCGNCGDTYTQEVAIDEDAHDWGDWTVTTEPGCESKGEETRVCSYDKQHVETRPVDETRMTHLIPTLKKLRLMRMPTTGTMVL